jgi:hypothetical protein
MRVQGSKGNGKPAILDGLQGQEIDPDTDGDPDTESTANRDRYRDRYRDRICWHHRCFRFR